MSSPTDKYKGDVILYCGPILRDGYDKLSSLLESKQKKKTKLCLVLVTLGGDPDAAYRIARALNHHYETVEILIADVCKSAGTLLCIGASKLIFGDRGELGPLDIQLSKPDEMFDSMSGLDIIQALNALENHILSSFRTYLIDIRGGSQIRTKTAADIASKLADGFISPIAAKIDPITLGEHQRAMRIAYDYGQRLNAMVGSLKDNALASLVSGYASHGFVIDRREASELFNNVEAPDEATIEIYDWARQTVCNATTTRTPIILDIDEAFAKQIAKNSKDEDDATQSVDEPGSEEGIKDVNGKSEPKGAGNDGTCDKPKQARQRSGSKKKSARR